MYKYMTVDLNIFMVLLLLIIITMINSKQSYKSYSTRLFLRLCWSTILLLTLDALTWLLNGYDFVFNYVSIYAFYLFETLPLIAWLCYLDYHLHQSEKRLRKRWFYLHPAIVIFIILIVNAFTDFFFYFDENHMYQRGPGIPVIMGINFAVLLLMIFIALKQRKQLEKRVFHVLVMFGILPIIGGIAQMFVYGASVLWNAVALAVISVYIFLETQKELRDYLTGLLNRQQIDDLIFSRIIDYEKQGGFAVIMLDMDDFKYINDLFGHKEGDRALIRLSEILYHSVKSIDRVARFGGDEFLILLEENRTEKIIEVIERIQELLETENRSNNRPYSLSVSTGYSIYSPERHEDAHELLVEADGRMYSDKNGKKKHYGVKL